MTISQHDALQSVSFENTIHAPHHEIVKGIP
jgi:hypothetical protein